VLPCLLHSHVQDLGNGPALVLDLQGLPVVAASLTLLALDVDIGQKVHLDLDQAVPLAGLTPPPPQVEGEAPRLVAPDSGLLGLGKGLADGIEDLGVGGGIGAGGAADGTLVYDNDLVHLQVEGHAVELSRLMAGLIDLLHQCPVEGVVDQGGLARSRDTSDGGKYSQGYGHIYVLEIVLPAARQSDE